MLFLLKRTWYGGLAGLLVLATLGLSVRYLGNDVPPVAPSWGNLGWGVVVFGVVLISDLLLHLLFRATFGGAYLRRYLELAGLFREQSWLTLLVGALLAGVGEELVFRGATMQLGYLVAAVVPFGLLHHVRRSLWPFTLWAAYQGLLFALALHLTGSLIVTMTAHFLHDFCGFLAFRHLNRGGPDQ